MPIDSSPVKPERFMAYKGLKIYHTYVGNDISQGRHDMIYTVDERCEILACHAGHDVCRAVFDIRDLPCFKSLPDLWRENGRLVKMKGPKDLSRRIRILLRYAINYGELDWKGTLR